MLIDLTGQASASAVPVPCTQQQLSETMQGVWQLYAVQVWSLHQQQQEVAAQLAPTHMLIPSQYNSSV
jgi:hypothetical protein